MQNFFIHSLACYDWGAFNSPPPPVKITDLIIYSRKTKLWKYFLLHACKSERRCPQLPSNTCFLHVERKVFLTVVASLCYCNESFFASDSKVIIWRAEWERSEARIRENCLLSPRWTEGKTRHDIVRNDWEMTFMWGLVWAMSLTGSLNLKLYFILLLYMPSLTSVIMKWLVHHV